MFESLAKVPISSPMAWDGNQGKKFSILSFSGKPPPMESDARVLFFLNWPLFSCSGFLGSGSFSTIFFLSQRDCRVCIPGKQFWNHCVEPDKRSGEEPSFSREQVGTEEVELPSI